jgi:hypothetical protein
MFKICGSIAVIALIAGATSVAPEAGPALEFSAPNAALKGDRLDIASRRASCAGSQHDGTCMGDKGGGRAGEVRKVRVVPTDPLRTPDEQPIDHSQLRHMPQDRDRCVSLPPSCGSSRGSARAMI